MILISRIKTLCNWITLYLLLHCTYPERHKLWWYSYVLSIHICREIFFPMYSEWFRFPWMFFFVVISSDSFICGNHCTFFCALFVHYLFTSMRRNVSTVTNWWFRRSSCLHVPRSTTYLSAVTLILCWGAQDVTRVYIYSLYILYILMTLYFL